MKAWAARSAQNLPGCSRRKTHPRGSMSDSANERGNEAKQHQQQNGNAEFGHQASVRDGTANLNTQ